MISKSISSSVPSNIALVKYWGKKGRQLPENPSVSLTLSKALTTTKIHWQKNDVSNSKISLEFLFAGKIEILFQKRIQLFLDNLVSDFPWLPEFSFKIESENTFPHSSGIASSASFMASLAASLCFLEQSIGKGPTDKEEFIKRVSYIARLGSGSACRSVYAPACIWGEDSEIANSSNEYAIPVDNIHNVFQGFHDTILIVDSNKKEVGSSIGHSLMNNHPYRQQRYEEARKNCHLILEALRTGDLDLFIKVVESEALTLHGLMMTGENPYILMKPNTLTIINKIWKFRSDTKIPLAFTLDAGPNIHLLFPDAYSAKINEFIKNELINHLENGHMIEDIINFENPLDVR